MKKVALLICIFLPSIITAQYNLKNIRRKSWTAMAFRISARETEKYLREDSIPVDRFINEEAAYVFHRDSVNIEVLPKGHYVLISVIEGDLIASIEEISDIIVYPVNNQFNIQLNVRNKDGGFVDNAEVWINDKRSVYHSDSKTYWAKQKKIKEGLVRVYTPGDTCFYELEKSNDEVATPFSQRWKRFAATKTGKVITWIPKKIGTLNGTSSYKSYHTGASGYVLFNQPKYKLTDTVKLKAYIVNKRQKQYKENLNLFLEYYSKGRQNSQLLSQVDPISPGSYVYSFALSDTLESDQRYIIAFRNKKGKTVISKYFSTEDYLLDEITQYEFQSDKEKYYKNDSLVFRASAKDANNLPLLDGKAKLVLLTESINRFYTDSVQIPDTLYLEEKLLVTDNETTFHLSTANFPYADLKIKARIIFKNSNNEMQEQDRTIYYSGKATELILSTVADTVIAEYKVDGKSVTAKGTVDISGDLIDRTFAVEFPAKIKIDPLAEYYDFSVYNDYDTVSQDIDIENNYELGFSMISRGDTLGFSLANPNKVSVNFSILDGNKLIYSGREDKEIITWIAALSRKRMYIVRWQYMWGGRQIQNSQGLAVLYKVLKIKVSNNEIIYPGQKDTITIDVKDYNDKPAERVNLAAVAYNTQFKKDISVKEPPYLVNYHKRLSILREKSDIDFISGYKKYPLGNHPKWIGRFSLDTMPFYRILFPQKPLVDFATPISEFMPQLSIHVVQKGRPQEIFLLYINRKLAYYNGTTDQTQYSFETMEKFTQIGIRLYDKYIEIDSIYIQPFYKHDIVIDLDKLPTRAITTRMPTFWTPAEKLLIEKSIWQLDADQQHNNGYIWQQNRLTKLEGYKKHLAGPFNTHDSLHFYAPGHFDILFMFEPGYEYNLSNRITRLEKQTIFSQNQKEINLRTKHDYQLALGDTLFSLPEIQYIKNIRQPSLPLTPYNKYNIYNFNEATASLKFEASVDTVLKYVILYNPDTLFTNLVLTGQTRIINNIRPGKYHLLLVNRQSEVAALNNIYLKGGHTLCLQTKQILYTKENPLFDKLVRDAMAPPAMVDILKTKTDSLRPVKPLPPYPQGNGVIRGRIIDAIGGEGVAGALIIINGYAPATVTALDGTFVIAGIREAEYTLTISSIGYTDKSLKVKVTNEREALLNASLVASDQRLEEVVVTGYTAQKRKDIVGAISVVTVNELKLVEVVQGRAAGVDVSGGAPGHGTNVPIRGISGSLTNNEPIYLIDGIFYDKMPLSITPGMIENITTLNSTDAIAIYGSKAANGIVVITTGTKIMRDSFRDYAFWQPELFTNSEGKVSFEAVYPDNITGWEIYVLGMDKNMRIGKGVSFTRAYKPMISQLNAPQFLINGDSVLLVGKALNYTGDTYSIKTEFSANDRLIKEKDDMLGPNASIINYLPVKVDRPGIFTGAFNLKSSTGFADGEKREIPVLNIGSEEAKGQFYILAGDTVFNFSPVSNAGPLEIYAQNNTLDLLLNELEHLQKYPYYCMEQTASKLKGLLLEQSIREFLKQPLRNEKEIRMLTKKLQDAQLFNGGWGWWQEGEINIPVTTYIIEALQPLRKDPVIESSVRNGLLCLQNQLPYATEENLLQILSCFSSANHEIDYKSLLSKIAFDSLSQHQQWLWVQICQQQKIEHEKELKELVKQQIGGMLGGTHWGTETFRWYNNAMATTLLAYKVLEQDKNYQYMLDKIIQYFLEQRRESYWTNTVESASIVSAILPGVLKNNPSFNKPGSISIKGDSSFIINSFPYSVVLPASKTGQITVHKSGGGMTYLTLYQKWWNDVPHFVNDKFDIETYFERNGKKLKTITAGEKMKMKVKLSVIKESDYVMIEVPIPAGCTYAGKVQDNTGLHKEFLKNKLVLFVESLKKGEHVFDVELEPRYKGSFTLNPAKAELMYFPTFYGRNNIRKVVIE